MLCTGSGLCVMCSMVERCLIILYIVYRISVCVGQVCVWMTDIERLSSAGTRTLLGHATQAWLVAIGMRHPRC